VSKYEQKDMSGSLFKNEQKQTDRHPDYSGTATIDGVEMFMDAWIKTADTGRKWMSFSFKPKQKQAAPAVKQPAQPQRRRDTPEDDSDIPF
jgi:uncharacterized protein (DUF736 family)